MNFPVLKNNQFFKMTYLYSTLHLHMQNVKHFQKTTCTITQWEMGRRLGRVKNRRRFPSHPRPTKYWPSLPLVGLLSRNAEAVGTFCPSCSVCVWGGGERIKLAHVSHKRWANLPEWYHIRIQVDQMLLHRKISPFLYKINLLVWRLTAAGLELFALIC